MTNRQAKIRWKAQYKEQLLTISENLLSICIKTHSTNRDIFIVSSKGWVFNTPKYFRSFFENFYKFSFSTNMNFQTPYIFLIQICTFHIQINGQDEMDVATGFCICSWKINVKFVVIYRVSCKNMIQRALSHFFT